ncbi:ceramide synthase 5-like [Liolophura sinensis]|uniref:ceramide synthase 5-like n=1 Tax=Liolophura sinensis TaxID=3198878 RepID=UPI0031583BAE
MHLWDVFCYYFWNEKFWFPDGVSWSDLENKDDGFYHPQRTDLLWVFPIAALLFVLRKVFERFIAKPVALALGLKQNTCRVKPNLILEDAYKVARSPTDDMLQGLSKKTSMSRRQVERWFRVRRNQDIPSLLKKFAEGSWRFVYYLIIFFVGLYVLSDKPWFLDVDKCWESFPHQHVPESIKWYYLVELSFYVSLMFSQFFDVKRKDFFEMFVHHVATISLMFFSWCNNMVRIGTLILVVHDACDYLLELSKLLNYLKWDKICNSVFATFALMWLITRLTIFPFWIIHSTLFTAIKVVGFCNIYYLYNTFLILLQILHVVWFIFIAKVAYQALFKGQITKDARSETEEEISEEEKSVPVANGLKQTGR